MFKKWTLTVIFMVVAVTAFSQVFPEEEFLDVVRTVDGSVLKGRIVSDQTDDPVTLEIYGGSTFVIISENIQSVSQVRNLDYGKSVPTLNLNDLVIVQDDPEEQGPELPFVSDDELPTVRYPSFSGGIGGYASMGMSDDDRMIESSWYAGTLGAYIHSYDLIPMTIGLEIYGAFHGRNKHYRVYDSETDSDVNIYPHQDGFDSQLVPSFLIGNHWQSVAVGFTWLGILHERALFMPTMQWRNLRIAASLADEGYATVQYHLPLDRRAKATRERVAALREDGIPREYLVENYTWTRFFVRVVTVVGRVTTNPEIDYVRDFGAGPEVRKATIEAPAHNGPAVGFELNRTYWDRLDLGVGIEIAAAAHSGHIYITDEGAGEDEYEYRDAVGGYLRVAGRVTERMWAYGRFGMSATEILGDEVDVANQIPEIPNYGYFPHWWTDLGIGFGFLRNRQFGIDLEAGPRFSILQTGDVTDNKNPASIGLGVQASVRRNEAPVSHRIRSGERGMHPASRSLGKPILIRFAGGNRSNDQWKELDDPIDVSNAGTTYQGVTDYSYWDSEFHGAAEAAVQLLPAHAVGVRFQTNLTNTYSFIDVNTDGEEYRHLETDIAIPYGLFLFHHLTWRALGLKTQAGLRVAHIRYPDDPIFNELYNDTRTVLHWGGAIGPTVRLFQFGEDNRNQIDLGFTYRYEWINLQQIFDETLSAPGFEVEVGYARRYGGQQRL